MAHFAELDNNNIVVRVLVVDDSLEHRGEEFLSVDLELGGRWVQTSYNNRIRKQYAGIGYIYNEDADVFISPSPFPSWVLNDDLDWEAPTPRPEEGFWTWDEETLSWVEGNMSWEELNLAD
jgi:hypothetical protein